MKTTSTFLSIIFTFFISTFLTAQASNIVIDENANVEALVKSLFPNDGSVLIENIEFFGDPRAVGGFGNGDSSIALSEGLILSTGSVKDAVGPNSSTKTSTAFVNSGTVMDEDLQKLMLESFPSLDLAYIEFDIISKNQNLTLDYVFASEEYCDYVGSKYTDVFGIFLSGPNVVDTFLNQATNLAVLPDTNLYVGINSINWNNNRSLFNTNSPFSFALGGGCSFGELLEPTIARNDLEYDGFTDVLQAQYTILPNQRYHLKIAITDTGDKMFDSAIFLKSNSELVDPIDCTVNAKWSDNQDIVQEGCNTLNFEIISPLFANPTPDFNYSYQVSDKSTAVEGEDFQILAGMSTGQGLSFPIEIFRDETEEGEETIVLEISFNCGESTVELTKTIKDFVPLSISLADISICPGDAVFMTPAINDKDSKLTYLWSDGSTEEQLLVNGISNERIVLEVRDECGQVATDSATVKIIPNDLMVGLRTLAASELCQDQLIEFDLDLINTGGVILDINWDFGEGRPRLSKEFGPHYIEFLSSGEKEIHLEFIPGNECAFSVDTIFKIMIKDCEETVIAEKPDYEIEEGKGPVITNADSLKTTDYAYSNKDILVSPNGLVSPYLTFPILEKGANNFYNQLKIYNNLGQIIYHKNAYQNDWEGQHQNGQILPSGTYFYSLYYGQKAPHFQSGKIVWIR